MEEGTRIICNIIFFVTVLAATMLATGLIGYLMAAVSEGEKEGATQTNAWVVACFALAVIVCGRIFGG